MHRLQTRRCRLHAEVQTFRSCKFGLKSTRRQWRKLLSAGARAEPTATELAKCGEHGSDDAHCISWEDTQAAAAEGRLY